MFDDAAGMMTNLTFLASTLGMGFAFAGWYRGVREERRRRDADEARLKDAESMRRAIGQIRGGVESVGRAVAESRAAGRGRPVLSLVEADDLDRPTPPLSPEQEARLRALFRRDASPAPGPGTVPC